MVAGPSGLRWGEDRCEVVTDLVGQQMNGRAMVGATVQVVLQGEVQREMATVQAVLQAVWRLKPPVMASMSRTSPAK